MCGSTKINSHRSDASKRRGSASFHEADYDTASHDGMRMQPAQQPAEAVDSLAACQQTVGDMQLVNPHRRMSSDSAAEEPMEAWEINPAKLRCAAPAPSDIAAV